MSTTSRIPGFYRLGPEGRLSALQAHAALATTDVDVFRGKGLTLDHADIMVENVISTFGLPNAVAVNFLVNGQERIIPMVVEEPSVVAAVSNMARISRAGGGFTADSDPSVMIGQVQLMDVKDPHAAVAKLEAAIPALTEIANTVHPRLEARGGGLRGMEVRRVTYDEPGFDVEHMVVLHVYLDCADAMGANMINTVVERLAPYIETATQERVGLRILSNLADRRCARARIELPVAALETKPGNGLQVAHRIAAAWRFAWADPYRAATHNKGVMNGIDAVALATGNDWRAIEAGAHAWASRDGQYRPLTRWVVQDDQLVGTIELPLQFGTIGGTTNIHPTVRSNLNLSRVKTAGELAALAAAVGLAQNMGALRALATEGIQAGHMRMHARTVAANAGATNGEINAVCGRLCDQSEFSIERARIVLKELRADAQNDAHK